MFDTSSCSIRFHESSILVTKPKLLPLFVIVAVAAMMGTASIAPAYAAQKTTDTKFNIDYTYEVIVCEQVVQADVNNKGHFIIWDNNKFNFKTTIVWKFTDASGNNVGHHTGTNSQHGTIGDTPQVYQVNGITTCAGTGQVSYHHFGVTLHKDGTVNIHS